MEQIKKVDAMVWKQKANRFLGAGLILSLYNKQSQKYHGLNQ